MAWILCVKNCGFQDIDKDYGLKHFILSPTQDDESNKEDSFWIEITYIHNVLQNSKLWIFSFIYYI